jgi:uncharacterized protein (TIGR03083 family)
VIDYGEAYGELRARVTALVAEADPTVAVPGTPEWTVKDVVAHLTGIVADMSAGNLADVGSPAWTAAQVDGRRATSLDGVLTEWNEIAPPAEALAGSFGEEAGLAWLSDAGIHEHDLHAALGAPRPTGTAASRMVLGAALRGVDRRLREADVPAVAFHLDTEELRAGPGGPGAVVAVDPWELTRALSGRRSAGQIRSWAWLGDPEPYLARFAPAPGYALPTRDLVD